jgi:mannose-6-phosphate isomerase-like protein (cupin superfamily)
MPPAHSHVGNEEAYFVLDGVVEFRVAGEVFEGTNGTFVLVPAGEPHTFGNTGGEPARLLVLHAPPLDHYFEELEQLWASPEPPGRDAEIALMRRHGMEPT